MLAGALGVYRFWRNSGYAVGALLSGMVADDFGFEWAIALAGLLTLLSGLGLAVGMREEPFKTGVTN